MVGRLDRLLVVLDDQDRVAEVPEPEERVEQAPVVPLVEADRRLVEDVEDADQARSDLRRQADPLSLAARERAGRAVEREVLEPHVLEEAEPLADLLEDAAGDRLLALAEGEPVEEGAGLLDRERAHLVDRAPADADGEALGPEAAAAAARGTAART